MTVGVAALALLVSSEAEPIGGAIERPRPRAVPQLAPPEVEIDILLPRRESCRDIARIHELVRAAQADPDRAQDLLIRAESALEAYFDSKFPPLRKEAQRLAADIGPYSSPEAARAFATLIASRNSTVLGFESLERDLLRGAVEELGLDDTFAAEIEHQRLAWTRRRIRELRCDLVPARVDLEELLALPVATEGAVRDPVELKKAQFGYGEEVTSLLSQWSRLRLRTMADDATKSIELGDDVESFLVARRRLSQPPMRVEHLIVEATRQWAERIAETLNPRTAERFIAAFKAASYPSIYPNPYSIGGLGKAVIEASIEPEIKSAAIEALQSLDAQIAEVDRQMEATCLRAWEEWGVMRSVGMPTDASLRAATEHLTRRRRALAIEALTLVADAGLPPEAPEVVALLRRVHPVESEASTEPKQ